MATHYSPEDIDRALMEIVLAGGNIKLAHRRLKDRELNIPYSTLKTWPEQHAERLDKLRREYSHKVAEKIAAEAEELAVQYAAAEREALALARDKLASMKGSELTRATKEFAIAKAIQVDKLSSPLRGRPTSITETRNPQDAVRALAQSLGMEHVLDTDAEDITAQPELPQHTERTEPESPKDGASSSEPAS